MPANPTSGRVEPFPGLRVALVHDWLTGMRGGERCLEVFSEIFPSAEIYTLIHVRGSVSRRIERMKIQTSPLQRLPGIGKHYRLLLPLFPWAIEQFELGGYDLVFSSSHCAAKGVRPRGAPHLSYCHTPMRYLWDRFEDYFGRERAWPLRAGARILRRSLQEWDVASSRRVDRFLANSAHVARRIDAYYGRSARIIHPPVDLERFSVSGDVADFYLMVSALAPYKRIDVAIEAFRELGRPLLIVGRGPEEAGLRRLAGGAPNIHFLGWRPDDEVARLMSQARAFVLPGEEDFGITALEAMAAGRPVLALGRGGACETVVGLGRNGESDPTGILFEEPSAPFLIRAIELLERRAGDFRPESIRRHAERFSRPRFRREIEDAVRDLLEQRSPPLREEAPRARAPEAPEAPEAVRLC